MKKFKFHLFKIIFSVMFLALALIFKQNEIAFFVLSLIAYLVCGYDIILKALRNIITGKVFDENFLMFIGTLGAFILREYLEGALVMILFQIGELFQNVSVSRSRRSIESLLELKEEYAYIYDFDNSLMQVYSKDVSVGCLIVVKPGQRVPLDGVVVKGYSSLDTKMLTGESKLKDVSVGDEILSGVINLTSILEIEVKKEYKDTTVSKILELTLNALDKKTKTENYITRFARLYTPIVLLLAILISTLVPFLYDQNYLLWLERGLTFLVISCPCALVISVPLTYFGGIGLSSKNGILVKGSNFLEVMKKTDAVIFDKTGTLTKGVFEVTSVVENKGFENKVLMYAAYCEYYSDHPIAKSIKRKYEENIDVKRISNHQDVFGKGVKITLNNEEIIIGNIKMMNDYNIKVSEVNTPNTVIYVSKDKELAGYIIISDIIKDESLEVIKRLKFLNKKTIILTGDSKGVAEECKEKLQIDEVYYELLPQDKVNQIEIIKNKYETVCFVGDGINDAPVLTYSDCGISMGSIGSDAAIEASDIVIMDDDLNKIPKAIKISHKTIRIVKQNIYFIILVKFSFLVLAAFGYSSMLEAVIADVGVSVIAILNALRILRYKV